MPPKKLIIAWIAAAVLIAGTVSLGNWQTRRADTKLALQAQADAADRVAPLEITPTPASIEAVASSLPRRVRLNGTFEPGGSIYLDNRTLNGIAGLYVITPLVIGDGLPAVLIDRGWMPRDMQDRKRIAAPTPSPGRVTIEGVAVARPSTLFELGDQGEREVPGLWHNLDYAAYERTTGRSVARFVVRQHDGSNAAGGLRREWPQPVSGVEKHRGYAVQWYSLAALITIFTAWSGWKAWRGR